LSDDEDMEASESAFCGGSNPIQDISTSIDNALPSGIERRGLYPPCGCMVEQGHKASFLKDTQMYARSPMFCILIIRSEAQAMIPGWQGCSGKIDQVQLFSGRLL